MKKKISVVPNSVNIFNVNGPNGKTMYSLDINMAGIAEMVAKRDEIIGELLSLASDILNDTMKPHHLQELDEIKAKYEVIDS